MDKSARFSMQQGFQEKKGEYLVFGVARSPGIVSSAMNTLQQSPTTIPMDIHIAKQMATENVVIGCYGYGFQLDRLTDR